ncbi:HNH endonuclease [Leptospira limi]|uniref:HNH endonuclease n=1 Tax=Leptospira limi TaxID=2950023 RepID=UPI003898E366
MRKILYFSENYDIVFQGDLKGSKRYLEDSEKYVCRFCGSTHKEATFTKDAHAISESIGNKSLLSYSECDECNKIFGNGIEDHLGKFLLPLKNASAIKGKNSKPTYTSPSNESRIDFKDGTMNIHNLENNPFVEIDNLNKTMIINYVTTPHIPAAVFKAFVKFFLSVIKEDDFRNKFENVTK